MGEQRRDDLRFDSWGGAGDGGLVVYDPVTDAGHLLNPATAAVFEACDGQTSVDEMAERVAARTGLPADRGIVELALAELDEVGLLSTTGPSAADDEPRGISRRALIGRLTLGAAAVALLPAVETVVGTSQLAAATPVRTQTAADSLVADPKTATHDGEHRGRRHADDDGWVLRSDLDDLLDRDRSRARNGRARRRGRDLHPRGGLRRRRQLHLHRRAVHPLRGRAARLPGGQRTGPRHRHGPRHRLRHRHRCADDDREPRTTTAPTTSSVAAATTAEPNFTG